MKTQALVLLLLLTGCVTSSNPYRRVVMDQDDARKITATETVSPHAYRRSTSVAVTFGEYGEGMIIDTFWHAQYQWRMYHVWHLDGTPYQVLIKKATDYCLGGRIWEYQMYRSQAACASVAEVEAILERVKDAGKQPL